jgi:1-acyl-sn-glycerol-3-phosphate acyltransferase
MSKRPNPMPRYYRWRSNFIQVPFLAVITVICGSIALFVSLFEKNGRVQHRIAQFWARLLVRLSGSKLTICGRENLMRYPVAVYASNHTSYMDTPVIFASLPFQFRILAKKELWPIAFIGWYLNRSGQIAIDTVTARGTLTSLATGVRATAFHVGSRVSCHSCPGAAGSHCSERRLRSFANAYTLVLSERDDAHRRRAHRHKRHDNSADRGVESAATLCHCRNA